MAKLYHKWQLDNNYILDFAPIVNGIAAATSSGKIVILNLEKPLTDSVESFQAHPNAVPKIYALDSPQVLSSCSTDSVKIWDLRDFKKPSLTLHGPRHEIPYLSLDYNGDNLLAAGTELYKNDAEIHIWDIRNSGKSFKYILDTQHDDVTDLKFHPSNKNMLMSGSSDGYINVFDLTQDDEDDCLHQTIDFASIHSIGWLPSNKIYSLSHMETFAIHTLSDLSVESAEPAPLEFGDIRKKWGCEYVVDVFDGYIACGSINEENQLKLLQFSNQSVDPTKSVIIPNPHGEEITRCIYQPPEHKKWIVSGGEDGAVNVWKLKNSLAKTLDIKSTVDDNDTVFTEKAYSKKSKESKETKKSKSHGKKKLVKKHKFKPY